MEKIRNNMLKNEIALSKYASKDKDAFRLNHEDNDMRPNYFRDIDRVIYSLSYARYTDKTQVFSNIKNDHISKRIIHVQLVSKIARTIGRAINLNEDLIEAIALGHDIGHVPFGHAGEAILNTLSIEHKAGFFVHNAQSVRTMMTVDNNGLGHNLTVQVLDGILCHNGEFLLKEYYPKKKTKEEFLNDYNNCFSKKAYYKHLIPMTLEGCVVRISDIIGYLGRDIEDAIRLNILDVELPTDIKNILGSSNRDIINNIILDIVENSYDKPFIKMSTNIYNAIVKLKDFNIKHIYNKANSVSKLKQYRKMFTKLFDVYLYDIKNDKKTSICYYFLSKMNNDYMNNYSDERKVIDYIAGMTDDYFQNEYEILKESDCQTT
ncbi:MAG: HD domain-containing protein [Bacilli bacterium]